MPDTEAERDRRLAREAGLEAASDVLALAADRKNPLVLTRIEVEQIAEVVIVRHLKRIALNTDEDKIEETAHRVRSALAFPASAWSFIKWAGGVFGTAILTSIAGLVMALIGRAK